MNSRANPSTQWQASPQQQDDNDPFSAYHQDPYAPLPRTFPVATSRGGLRRAQARSTSPLPPRDPAPWPVLPPTDPDLLLVSGIFDDDPFAATSASFGALPAGLAPTRQPGTARRGTATWAQIRQQTLAAAQAHRAAYAAARSRGQVTDAGPASRSGEFFDRGGGGGGGGGGTGAGVGRARVREPLATSWTTPAWDQIRAGKGERLDSRWEELRQKAGATGLGAVAGGGGGTDSGWADGDKSKEQLQKEFDDMLERERTWT